MLYLNRYEIRFRDGIRQMASKSRWIPASHLSPGDVVCFTYGPKYDKGLVLEYNKEDDQFYVARSDGVIFRCVD